jgi:hypothetical protein
MSVTLYENDGESKIFISADSLLIRSLVNFTQQKTDHEKALGIKKTW